MVNGDSGSPGLHAVSHVGPVEPGSVTHLNLPTKASLAVGQRLRKRLAMINFAILKVRSQHCAIS